MEEQDSGTEISGTPKKHGVPHHERHHQSFFYRLIVKADPFRVSNACVGCGQCASKCPLNNIEIRNGKPRYRFEELEI